MDKILDKQTFYNAFTGFENKHLPVSINNEKEKSSQTN